MNKKGILLAGAALLMAGSASAAELNPYVGLDYVYSKAHFKSGTLSGFSTNNLKKNYNSGAINLGVRPDQYFSLEAFFQQSDSQKGHRYDDTALSGRNHVKSEFYAYGLDAYGYMPIGCNGFNLLGTVGLANYNFKIKSDRNSVDKQRIGYRAGLGAQYDINENLAVRVVGRYSYINSRYLDDLKEVTAGIRYTF